MIPSMISVGERMTLRLCRTEKFKAGMLSLSMVLPIQKEETYLTSLLLSVLLRGTQKYPTVSALNRRLDYLFGTELSIRNFYRGDVQVIGLCADLLEHTYLPEGEWREDTLPEGALEVMSQILFFPKLDENGLLDAGYVESEKKLQCDTIRAQKNQPHAYASDRCRAIMYENEPCGVPVYGDEEAVMAVTPARLTAHWKKLLSSLSLHVFYVGRLHEDVLVSALHRAFDAPLSQAVCPPQRVVACAPHPMAQTCRREEESLPVNQGHLIIGLRMGCVLTDRDFYACVLLNELLGASPVSKLFMNVREKLSLCYSCHSVYNAYKGTILIWCGLENEQRERAEREIFAQLDAIANGEFDDAEWEGAKKSLENAYRQLEDSPTAMESFYFGRGLVGSDVTVEQCRAHFAGVDRADVIRLAKEAKADTVFFLRQTGNGEGMDDEDD